MFVYFSLVVSGCPFSLRSWHYVCAQKRWRLHLFSSPSLVLGSLSRSMADQWTGSEAELVGTSEGKIEVVSPSEAWELVHLKPNEKITK